MMGVKTMPGLLRSFLGFIILVATIGLATCQSMVKADPSDSAYSAETFSANRSQAE
jgi:predicted lipid-binding transport protein (Tim44 family)